MAYILTIVFIGLVQNGEQSFWPVLLMFFTQLLLEVLSGISSASEANM